MEIRVCLFIWLCQLALQAAGGPTPGTLTSSSTITTFDEVIIAHSPKNYTASGTLYARAIQLADSSLLATWENYSPEPPMVYFPIYRSTDYGHTWSELSRVQDQVRGVGLRYQPFLYVLPGSLGKYPAGTLLLAGNAIPTNLSSTHLELYASPDSGRTWNFVSHIADGGKALPNNGETPVWEPFLLYRNNQLIVYYSDQRDPAHGQKLVHQTTSDGTTWSSVITDVAEADYNLRPGMPVVAQLQNGSWILTYENVNYPGQNAPAFYKISNDPLSWNDKTGVMLVASGGSQPRSSPYVVVTRAGRVLVSGGQTGEIFINDANAAANAWRSITPPQARSYTRCLTLVTDSTKKQYVMITGGGWFGNGPNNVTTGIEDPSLW